jgi:phosphoglycerate dehydrogenase-like enzyme
LGAFVVKIAVLDDYVSNAATSADWSELPAGASVDFFHEPLSEVEAGPKLKDYEIIVTMRERMPFPAALLRQLTNTKLIMCNGRNTLLDQKTATELGIRVVNSAGAPGGSPAAPGTPSATTPTIAGGPTGELTWGLILATTRHLVEEVNSFRSGGWVTHSGPGLYGKTIGIVGLGRIGSGVARIANGFGMKVIAWSQNLTEERAAEANARLVAKDELFRNADIVTIHLVLSDRSRGIVGAHELGLMKPTSYLINTSRGSLIADR